MSLLPRIWLRYGCHRYLLHLSENVIGVFSPYALKDGCRKTSFVKGPTMNGEFGRPRLEIEGLLWITWQYFVHQVIPDGVHSARLKHYRGHFFHRRRSPRVLRGARLVLVFLDPPMILLLALPRHLPAYSLSLGHA